MPLRWLKAELLPRTKLESRQVAEVRGRHHAAAHIRALPFGYRLGRERFDGGRADRRFEQCEQLLLLLGIECETLIIPAALKPLAGDQLQGNTPDGSPVFGEPEFVEKQQAQGE